MSTIEVSIDHEPGAEYITAVVQYSIHLVYDDRMTSVEQVEAAYGEVLEATDTMDIEVTLLNILVNVFDRIYRDTNDCGE